MRWTIADGRCAWQPAVLPAALLLSAVAAGAAEVSRAVPLADESPLLTDKEGDVRLVPEGPAKRPVLRADTPFAARIDLSKAGIEPGGFDLLKLDVKTDGRPLLVVSLENHPRAGELSHWYVLAATRGPFDWQTLWIDLRRPEEIKAAGSYKGMAEADASLRGLRLKGRVFAAGVPGKTLKGSIRLANIRFARRTVEIDWDQRRAPHSPGKDGGVAFRYPLTVSNRLGRPLTALLRLEPLDAEHARAELSRARVKLAAGETKTVEATVRLPAAAAKQPLYCERFLALAEAGGVADSRVTILRSSDAVPLTATAAIAEAKLHFPLLPRRKGLPDSVTGFARRREAARQLAEQARPDDLAGCLGAGIDPDRRDARGLGLYPWGKGERAKRYLAGLTACAFLYDETRQAKYLRKGTAMLLAAAELFGKLQEKWARKPAARISHGILAVNTLRLGWATGSMRAPYRYDRHGMFNDFDLLAADMKPADRRRIIDGFIVPAAIHMRNHTFGLGNQQDVVNYPILYAGLAGRNWPLVSFAYSSQFGLLNQMRLDFSADGLAGEGHYHTPAIRPILYAAELLYRCGVDLYGQRLYLITHSPAADAVGKPFRDSIRDYVDAHRFAGKKLGRRRGAGGGIHLATGVTTLRRRELEVSMNWGMQIHRGAPDRCALRIQAPERHPLHRIGGGNYSHSSLGQSILIVDEALQKPVPARVSGFDVDGAVQFVQAVSARHYPGSTVTRTFALLGDVVLAIDRVTSDRPRTVDWCLRYAGGHQTYEDVAKGIALPLKHENGSFTTKPGDKAGGVNYGARLKSDGYFTHVTDKVWRQANGALVMAAAPRTQVMVFAVPAAFSASRKERATGVPVLMVRRKAVQRTHYAAAFGRRVERVERVPPVKADSTPARAVAVRIRLAGGRTFTAIANYEGEGVEVRAGGLKTSDRFATDFQPQR